MGNYFIFMNDLNKFYDNIAKLLVSRDSECRSLAITYMKSLIPDIPKEKQNFYVDSTLELLYNIIKQCENNPFRYEYQLNNVTLFFLSYKRTKRLFKTMTKSN